MQENVTATACSNSVEMASSKKKGAEDVENPINNVNDINVYINTDAVDLNGPNEGCTLSVLTIYAHLFFGNGTSLVMPVLWCLFPFGLTIVQTVEDHSLHLAITGFPVLAGIVNIINIYFGYQLCKLKYIDCILEGLYSTEGERKIALWVLERIARMTAFVLIFLLVAISAISVVGASNDKRLLAYFVIKTFLGLAVYPVNISLQVGILEYCCCCCG